MPEPQREPVPTTTSGSAQKAAQQAAQKSTREAAREAALGVTAVARRLGVASATLRTWDRRYGLGPSNHVAGARRRYTSADLSRLEVMRRLLLEGVSPGEAARVVLARDGAGAPEDWCAPGGPGQRRERPGGGRVVPLRDASPAARGLARAAMSLDADACTDLLATAVRTRGVVAAWNELLVPVLTGIGERWRVSGGGVEVEHLLSECAETVLRAAVGRQPRARHGRPVLLAGLEPEDHRLPLIALAAALAERGIPTRSLGARLPLRGLADAVARTGASAVFLWAQGAQGPGVVPDAELFRAVRPRPGVVLGGPGYEAARWRRGMVWVDGLAGAVQAVTDLSAVTDVRGQRPPER